MVEFKELEKRSTISYMKGSFKTIFIMVMVGIFIPMVTSILAIGSMESAQAGVNSSINLEKFMKVCGKTASLLEIEYLEFGLIDLKLNCYKKN